MGGRSLHVPVNVGIVLIDTFRAWKQRITA